MASSRQDKNNKPQLNEVTRTATALVRAMYSSTSTHNRQLARAERYLKPPKYPTIKSLPEIYVQRRFCDTYYLICSLPTDVELEKTAKGKIKLPKSLRDDVKAFFGCHVQTSAEKLADSSYNGVPRMVVQVKSQNVPLENIYKVNQAFKDNGGAVFVGSTLIEYKDSDYTQNSPGSVTPIAWQDQGKLLNDTWQPVQTVKNGLQCPKWFLLDTSVAPSEHRLTVENSDGVLTRIGKGKQWRADVKVYAKITETVETTGVQNPSGNNKEFLFHSRHNDIQVSMRDEITQQENIARLEIRLYRWQDAPTSDAELAAWLNPLYDAITPKYCYSESFLEFFGWFLKPEQMHQVGLVLPSKTGGKFACCVVNWFNATTHKYNVESFLADNEQEVIHFFSATKMAKTPLAVYWQKEDKSYVLHEFGETVDVPNITYISPHHSSVKDRHGINTKWSKVPHSEVGLDGVEFPYLVSDKYSKCTLLNFEKGVDSAPKFTTQKEQTKAAALWVKSVKKRIKALVANLGKEHSACRKCRAFGEMPGETLRVLNVFKNKHGEYVLECSNGYSYRVNTGIGKQLLSLLSKNPKLFTTYPVLIIRGEANDRLYKGNKVYGQARLVVGDSEEVCDAYPLLRPYNMMHWRLDQYEKYKDVPLN